jgi:hypothetical protein
MDQWLPAMSGEHKSEVNEVDLVAAKKSPRQLIRPGRDGRERRHGAAAGEVAGAATS